MTPDVPWNQEIEWFVGDVVRRVEKTLNCSGFGMPRRLAAPSFNVRKPHEEKNVRVGKIHVEFTDVDIEVDVVLEREAEGFRPSLTKVSRIEVTVVRSRSSDAWIRRIEKVAGPIDALGWGCGRDRFVIEGDALDRLTENASRKRNWNLPRYYSS